MLMPFPEPVIKCPAPQDAELPWFSPISTEFEGICCFLARTKQQQDQALVSGRDVPSQLCVMSTAPNAKNFPGQKRENLSIAKPLFIIFPLQIAAILWLCLLQPPYLFFFFPFAWWHSVSSVIANIIHSVSLHETSFSRGYEDQKFRKSTIVICQGGKRTARSQAEERRESVQSAGPTAAERRIPLWNSILFHSFSKQLIFLGVEEGCQVKGHEHQSPLLILCNRAKFPPNTVPMGPNRLPEESSPQKKSCVTPLPAASGRAASSSLCGRHRSTRDPTSISKLLLCWPLNRNHKQELTLHLSSLQAGHMAFSRLSDKWILRMSFIHKVFRQ